MLKSFANGDKIKLVMQFRREMAYKDLDEKI